MDEPTIALRDVKDQDLSQFFDDMQDQEALQMAAFTPEDPADRDAFMSHWDRLLAADSIITRSIVADGELRQIEFDTRIDKSSWIAIRILPSSHSNPVFVLVGDKPIRASKKSAEWCLAGVANCKKQKRRFIKSDELDDFEAAYEHARKTYEQIIRESD